MSALARAICRVYGHPWWTIDNGEIARIDICPRCLARRVVPVLIAAKEPAIGLPQD